MEARRASTSRVRDDPLYRDLPGQVAHTLATPAAKPRARAAAQASQPKPKIDLLPDADGILVVAEQEHLGGEGRHQRRNQELVVWTEKKTDTRGSLMHFRQEEEEKRRQKGGGGENDDVPTKNDSEGKDDVRMGKWMDVGLLFRHLCQTHTNVYAIYEVTDDEHGGGTKPTVRCLVSYPCC